EIKKKIETLTGIGLGELRGSKRDDKTVAARVAFCHLARTELGMNRTELSTVLNTLPRNIGKYKQKAERVIDAMNEGKVNSRDRIVAGIIERLLTKKI
ncbi:hypothetical protein COU61_02840, partial [Candidatus Pacearchaeota archaeon CG10_big_fil_rev_8_21_14_0_10_35_13]